MIFLLTAKCELVSVVYSDELLTGQAFSHVRTTLLAIKSCCQCCRSTCVGRTGH